MDDAPLMGKVHGPRQGLGELSGFAGRLRLAADLLVQGAAVHQLQGEKRRSLNQFHDEIRPAIGRCAGVQHFGNIGMVHERQRLALGFKAGQHLA